MCQSDGVVTLLAWLLAFMVLFVIRFRLFIAGSYGVGQNVAMGKIPWSKVVSMWYSEIKKFTYNGTNDLEKVGHYTQVCTQQTHDVDTMLIQC